MIFFYDFVFFFKYVYLELVKTVKTYLQDRKQRKQENDHIKECCYIVIGYLLTIHDSNCGRKKIMSLPDFKGCRVFNLDPRL